MKIEYSLQDVNTTAEQILKHTTSKILLFDGEMGVGKTTLIKSLVKLLGSVDTISSPTYSIVNEYNAENGSIYHFDLYRIEDEEELYNFGIEDYLNTSHWILVEWPDILSPLIQNSHTTINIQLNIDSTRTLVLTNIHL